MPEEPFVIETRHGRVELHGQGPWRVHQQGYGSFTIHDANGNPARPTVWQRMSGIAVKPNKNVVWAASSVPNVIVQEANEAFAAQQK